MKLPVNLYAYDSAMSTGKTNLTVGVRFIFRDAFIEFCRHFVMAVFPKKINKSRPSYPTTSV